MSEDDDDGCWMFPSVLESIRTVVGPKGGRKPRTWLSGDMDWYLPVEDWRWDGATSKTTARNMPPVRGGGVVVEPLKP